MHSLDGFVFAGKDFNLIILIAYFLSKAVDVVGVCFSGLLPFTVCNINILLILLFESVDGFIKFKLIFSLNGENFILKLFN